MNAHAKFSVRLATFVALASSASATVTMDWVVIKDVNNPADPATTFGSVNHVYQIGKYEVTNNQYAEFLNAKGKSDATSYSIYNGSMSNYGITKSGSNGSYTYTVTSGFGNRPVPYVSWYDAARFANWILNGQGSGDMETGAYTLNGATSGGFIYANANAKIYLPSENEWYKAAYYNSANQTYSLFANGTNSVTPGDANFSNVVRHTTDVGTYSSDPSYYGTFDQTGNLNEWNDTVFYSSKYGYTFRGVLGGDYLNNQAPAASTSRGGAFNTDENQYLGFRLAGLPEPTSIVLTALSGGMLLMRRRR